MLIGPGGEDVERGPGRYVRSQKIWFFSNLVINRVWFLNSSFELSM